MRGPSSYSVIIPHYNDVARLMLCLEALVPQVTDEGDIIVADNGSDQELTPVTDKYPAVRIVSEPTPGAGPARNRGVAESRADWLHFIDSDCIPAPDWVAQGQRLRQGGQVISGRIQVFCETPGPMSGAEAFEMVFAFKQRLYLERDGFLASAHLVMSKAVFETVGGFQNTVSEDKDWSQRAVKAGFKLIYDDQLVVSHPARADSRALFKKWRRLSTESYALFRQSGGRRAAWALRAGAMPLSIMVHAMKIVQSDHLTALEKVRAFGALTTLRMARMVWMFKQVVTG